MNKVRYNDFEGVSYIAASKVSKCGRGRSVRRMEVVSSSSVGTGSPTVKLNSCIPCLLPLQPYLKRGERPIVLVLGE
jgi:hypothetical protein